MEDEGSGNIQQKRVSVKARQFMKKLYCSDWKIIASDSLAADSPKKFSFLLLFSEKIKQKKENRFKEGLRADVTSYLGEFTGFESKYLINKLDGA